MWTYMVTPYTETQAYTDLLSKVEEAINALETERNEIKAFLSTVKRGTPGMEPRRKRRDAITSLVKTKQGKRAKVVSLTLPPWDLVRIILDCDGTLWKTPEQQAKWHKELASHEGRGEASLRDWYGLPEKPPSQKDIDLPEVGVEAKNIQGRRGDGKFALQTIQAGSAGRQAYSMWMLRSAMSGLFNELSEDTLMALGTGEVTRPLLYGRLPTHIRDSLLAAVRPSVVFKDCQAIDCTTRDGFLHLDKSDFDAAWSTECVTKCGPKYTLRKGYLIDRLKASLSTPKDAADKAA